MADVVEIIVQDGIPGPKGDAGESAYQVAVDNGFEGTESEWLASLVGPQGIPGTDGADGAQGIPGTNGEPGANGLSAYEVWISQGNVGTEQDFLDSLVGPQGDQGIQGVPGQDGAPGEQGIQGIQGPKGDTGDTGPAGTTTWGGITDKPQVVISEQESGVGTVITNIIQVTQAQYDGLTPQAGTFYAIVG